MKRFLPILLFAMISTCATAADLKPFESDGCSAFPDGTLAQKKLWLKCCIAHDRAYWAGGTYQERKKADYALMDCVAVEGEPEIAQLMLAGVRVGGTPSLPTSFRWGYGWAYPRGYEILSKDEKAETAKSREETHYR